MMYLHVLLGILGHVDFFCYLYQIQLCEENK